MWELYQDGYQLIDQKRRVISCLNAEKALIASTYSKSIFKEGFSSQSTMSVRPGTFCLQVSLPSWHKILPAKREQLAGNAGTVSKVSVCVHRFSCFLESDANCRVQSIVTYDALGHKRVHLSSFWNVCTRMNHLFLGFTSIMSVTAPIVAQQTTMPADSKQQKTLKTVSNGFVMIASESMLNPKNKWFILVNRRLFCPCSWASYVPMSKLHPSGSQQRHRARRIKYIFGFWWRLCVSFAEAKSRFVNDLECFLCMISVSFFPQKLLYFSNCRGRKGKEQEEEEETVSQQSRKLCNAALLLSHLSNIGRSPLSCAVSNYKFKVKSQHSHNICTKKTPKPPVSFAFTVSVQFLRNHRTVKTVLRRRNERTKRNERSTKENTVIQKTTVIPSLGEAGKRNTRSTKENMRRTNIDSSIVAAPHSPAFQKEGIYLDRNQNRGGGGERPVSVNIQASGAQEGSGWVGQTSTLQLCKNGSKQCVSK